MLLGVRIGQPVGLAPDHCHQPGPQHLEDAEGRQQVVQRIYLVLFPGYLDDHRLSADIDDISPEEINDLDNLATGHRCSLDLDQGQLPAHDGLAGDIRDLDNVDEFVQLLDHADSSQYRLYQGSGFKAWI